MSKIMEELRIDTERRNRGRIAMNMLSKGICSHEEIAEVTGVPLEVVEEFAREIESGSEK